MAITPIVPAQYPTRPSVPATGPEKVVVLVAGVSYKGCLPAVWDNVEHKFKSQFEGSFRDICDRRVTYLLGRKREGNYKFFLFDMGGGVVLTRGQRGTWKPVSTGYFTQLGDRTKLGELELSKLSTMCSAFYERARFAGYMKNPGKSAHVMSITHIYNWLRWYGLNAEGTIIELSFFSHANAVGPILINTDDRERRRPARDPQDKDPRRDKDFRSPNMTADDVALCRKAFDAESGRIWIWGCDAHRTYLFVYRAILRDLTAAGIENPRKNVKVLPDSIRVDIKFEKWEAEICYGSDPFFPEKGSSQLTFTRTIGQIRNFYRHGLEQTFMAEVARTVGVRSYGAFPGTWASISGRDGLMEVLKQPPSGEEFRELIEFYANFLGVKEDPESRGYGTFDPQSFGHKKATG